jgi:ribosomal protein S18 acetylase RimI-like enzyme
VSLRGRDEVKVRPFREQDAGAVFALGIRLADGAAPWRAHYAAEAAVLLWLKAATDQARYHPEQLLVAADSFEQVVGFVTLETHLHWTGAKDARIGELVVDADREHQGIGGLLVDAALDWARRAGHARLTVSAGATNTRALRLYAGHGFDTEDVVLSRDTREIP